MPGVKLVTSYSHQDQAWNSRLSRHLKIFELSNDVILWCDWRIPFGVKWREEILKAIDIAQLAVLLISADFLSSDFIIQVELPRILERTRAGELKVVPVLVQHCPWQDIPWLAELQMRPWNAVPLAGRSRHGSEAELAKIAREILAIARACPDTPRLPL
jgi:TIR domain